MKQQLSARVLLPQIFRISIPSIFSVASSYMLDLINMCFIGHLNKKEMLAGVGLGNMFISMFGTGVFIGGNGAVDTLASQAFGSRNLRQCGVVLNQARLFLTGFVLLQTIAYLNSSRILQLFGIDEEITQYAFQYCVSLLPYVYLNGQFDAIRRFLNCQNMSHVTMIAQTSCIFIHLILCYIFVLKFGMQITGVTISVNITIIIQLSAVLIYCSLSPKLSKSWFLPQKDTLVNFKKFVILAMSGLIIQVSENGTFQLLTLMSTLIGITQGAAQLVIITFAIYAYMIPLGTQMAAAAVVGQSIGEGSAVKAKAFAKLCLIVVLVKMFIVDSCYKIFQNQIPYIFTQEEDVVVCAAIVLPYVGFAQYFDSIQSVLLGIIRGIGKQHITTLPTLLTYYGVSLTSAYFLAMKMELGLIGLWLGVAIGSIVLCIVLAVIILKDDWELIVKEKKEELDAVQKSQLEQVVNSDNLMMELESLQLQQEVI